MSPELSRQRLSRKEAAAYMRCSCVTFDRHIAPDVKPIKVGKRLFYMVADLEAWVDRQRDRAA